MKKSAFTLIELLVVIVIIGILATIGTVQFNDYQKKARLAKSISFASQAGRVFTAKAIANSQADFMSYNFDEGSGALASDHSGNGNNFNLTLDANTQWSNETPFPNGYSIKTNTKRLVVNTPASFNPDGMAMMAFFNIESYGTAGSFPFTIGNNGIRILPDGEFQFYILNSGGGYETLNSGVKTKLNTWQHVLATYDRNFMRLYLDGDLVGEKSYTDPIITYANMTIGFETPSYEITSLFDQVRIFPVGGQF
jgi:prepilin-type N-terminal cleavage/methylation domain-containing protein